VDEPLCDECAAQISLRNIAIGLRRHTRTRRLKPEDCALAIAVAEPTFDLALGVAEFSGDPQT
jgi:hypothetical protein